ncbi:MAG TPA: DUF998 domain-containing protein [Anaerolineaceae bacterium]|nr:DUF998 domain-containing protein [Anaerolineaceae bacterium]
MFEFLQTPASIRVFGILGGLVPLLACLVVAFAYRGKQGERYSLFNHFISELGELGVSKLAPVFNIGLMVCGATLLPCCIGLGLLIPGAWSKLGMVFGVLASIGVFSVGVFPMNYLKPHTIAAMSYFRLGMVMSIFFTLAIFAQPEEPPVLPRLLGLAGVPAVIAYASFLAYSQVKFKEVGQTLDPTTQIQRPRIWVLTLLEWAIFLTTVPWFLAIGLLI